MPIPVGLKGRAEELVTQAHTAQAVRSGTLPVFATPCLCALMEQAAWQSIAPALAPGESSVGTKLTLSHLSATPVGFTVWAESEVTCVEGKRIQFQINAFDQAGLIATGTHERFVVTDQRFLDKANGKQAQSSGA